VQDLLRRARWRNTQLSVTGVLRYGNECFVQVLEGEAAAVQEVYAPSRRDPRHHNILTFANKPIAQRAFPEWTMAFQPVTTQQVEKAGGYLGPPNMPLNTVGLPPSEGPLLDLLRAFVLP
jgi:hypothetical protein